MYCRNCGQPYQSENSAVCLKCGAPRGAGNSYCPYCGAPVSPGLTYCGNCGASLQPNQQTDPQSKSKIAAGLLGIFLGGLGIHNFYLGYTSKAVLQLCLFIFGMLTTCLVVGGFICLGIEIWGLVEGIMILTGAISTDGKGMPLRD